jgi:hypothetical protein
MTPARKSPGRPKGLPKTGGRKKGVRNKRSSEMEARIRASGMDPLAFLIALMRNAKAPLELRFEAARSAAPFVHPKLTAVEHSGPAGGAVQTETKQVSDIEAARWIGRLLSKVSASHSGDSGK